ncbi:GNAT family N-acetyltransferase [Aminobacter carboxidus]|uniref:GNAT family N-acetyltransferase n=1 Tax=Aminobacter carboxidus TaxID=376165 RepID=A0ABR9GW03_9HYPH|nr:GNAT family N-acetyltransferase [Aminobacter carboxidus]MBE1207873.1 GNAT family N-acetyltransferase [Aminobacter carboxidus]
MSVLSLRPLVPDAATFQVLRGKSMAEGFSMLRRLQDHWRDGSNTFAKPGEALFGVFEGTSLVGMGGLNVDPYFADGGSGRVRHVYVDPEFRRHGVGRLLIEAIACHARARFALLNLRAPDAAHAFYEALGFEPVKGEQFATHRRLLTMPNEGS